MRNAVLVAFAAVSLGGCVTSGPTATSPSAYVPPALDTASTRRGEYSGQDRYVVNYSAYLCDAPTVGADAAVCTKLKTGAKVRIGGVAGDISARSYAATSEGKSGYISDLQVLMMDSADAHRDQAAAKAECDRRGSVRVGMSKTDVLTSCWGKPRRVNSTPTARGTTEQWVYESRSLHFDESGRLTTIQQ